MTRDPADQALRWEALVVHRADLLRIARARTTSLDDAEDCV